MIAFGCPVTDRVKYKKFAEPGIRRAAEPDSALLLRHGAPSIQTAYNSIIEEAGAHTDLEALVLLHQDVELRDGDLAERLRTCMRDPLVAVVGAVGSHNVRTCEWWRNGIVGGVKARGSPGGHSFAGPSMRRWSGLQDWDPQAEGMRILGVALDEVGCLSTACHAAGSSTAPPD